MDTGDSKISTDPVSSDDAATAKTSPKKSAATVPDTDWIRRHNQLVGTYGPQAVIEMSSKQSEDFFLLDLMRTRRPMAIGIAIGLVLSILIVIWYFI